MKFVQATPPHTCGAFPSCWKGTTSCHMHTERKTQKRWTSGLRTGRGKINSQRREGKWRERTRTSGCNIALEGILHLAICNVSTETHAPCHALGLNTGILQTVKCYDNLQSTTTVLKVDGFGECWRRPQLLIWHIV